MNLLMLPLLFFSLNNNLDANPSVQILNNTKCHISVQKNGDFLYQDPKYKCPERNQINRLYNTTYELKIEDLNNNGKVDYTMLKNLQSFQSWETIKRVYNEKKGQIKGMPQLTEYAYFFSVKKIKNEYYKLIQNQKIKLNGVLYSFVTLYENFTPVYNGNKNNPNYIVLKLYDKVEYNEKRIKMEESRFLYKSKEYGRED
jgi:hypothetical protein